MDHRVAIRKQRTSRSRRESSGRCPDVKQLPIWLRTPLQRLVRSQPPMMQQWDCRQRSVLDWDSWVRQHLTRDYWQKNGTATGCWLSCVREWAATHNKEDFNLLPTPEALVCAIVTIAVAETLAHQHGTHYSKLDLQTRRHINTTASRQRKNTVSKVSLFHVAHLALARFDYDIFLQKLPCPPEEVRVLKNRMEAEFDTLHTVAASGVESSVLRFAVITLIEALRTSVRGFLFVPWHRALRLPLPGCTLLMSAVRSFVNCLPTLDVSFLFEAPLYPYNPQLTHWIQQLGSPLFDSRWKALTRFICLYYSSSPLLLGDDPIGKISFTMMTVILYAASSLNEKLLGNITAVATAQTYCLQSAHSPIVFRDMLNVKLGTTRRLQDPDDVTVVLRECPAQRPQILQVFSYAVPP